MPALEIALPDLEDAERAYDRVREELEALDPEHLSAHNLDLVAAASTALGVAPRILEYRERASLLVEYDIRNMDNLVDYAKTTWFLHITNLPGPETPSELEPEVAPLRRKLTTWARPLVAAGLLPHESFVAIKPGSGLKRSASNLVALASLYRANWSEIRTRCAVTKEELDRAAKIGAAVFASVSQKQQQRAPVPAEATLRARKAWTLLDRAYAQCQRAIAYFRFSEGDAYDFAPSLRRNSGGRKTPKVEAESAVVPEEARPEAEGALSAASLADTPPAG